MKISHYSTVTQSVDKEIGYTSICNKCGNKTEIHHEKHHGWEDDTKEFYVNFGYESNHDGETWTFDLCENCLVGLVKSFKHVPEGFRVDQYHDLSDEEHQKVFDGWKVTGEWEELKFKTYEELVAMNNGWYNFEYINDAVKKYHPDKPELIPVED